MTPADLPHRGRNVTHPKTRHLREPRNAVSPPPRQNTRRVLKAEIFRFGVDPRFTTCENPGVKRKKKRPRFNGESKTGNWALTIDPERKGFLVTDGVFRLFYPNFDMWSEEKGLATIRRQLEVERDVYGTLLFKTREDAIAAAMQLAEPDDHKTGGFCDCAQCVHYANEAKAREALKQPTIEL